MGKKNQVKYDAVEMEMLINGVANVVIALETLCEEIEPSVRQLTSENFLTGDDTEEFKDIFRYVNESAVNARRILNSLNKNFRQIAERMGFNFSIVRKSAEQATQDMKNISNAIRSATLMKNELPTLYSLQNEQKQDRKAFKSNKGGRPRILTEQQKGKILEWKNCKISNRQIAKWLRVSEGTIRNFWAQKK